MKITAEKNLYDFEAWSGAVSTRDRIIEEDKADEFKMLIEELYPDGIDETQLNDILWFDSDWVFEKLGINDENEEE